MSGQLLDARQVADRLGVDLKTIRRRTRRRELPAINIGTPQRPIWRYDEPALDAWLDQRRTA